MTNFFKSTRVKIIVFYAFFLLGITSLLAVDNLSLSTTDIEDNIVSGTSISTISSTNASGSVVYSFDCSTPGVDDSRFSIGGAGDELIINEDPDYWTKSSYDICIRATDDDGTYDENFTLNVVDKTNPEFTALTLLSNNSNSGAFAKAGDEIIFSFDLSTGDSWGAGNNLVFDIGNTIGEILNFDQSLTQLLSQNKTYIVLPGQSGSINLTSYTFVDNNSNSLNGLSLPYTFSQNIIVDTTSPNISFVDDVSSTPTLYDDINITVNDDYLDEENSLKYSYSSDSTCDDNDLYSESFTSGLTFTISDTLNNGKYVCVKAVDYAGNVTYLASSNPLDIAIPSISLSGTGINENLGLGVSIGDLSTTFSTGTTFDYALVIGTGSDDNASFSISGASLFAEFDGDFEVKNTYNIRISSTDENSNVIEKDFVIYINDVNENPTDISLSPVSIDENSGIGATVGDFTTTDEDSSDTHTYSLVVGSGSDDNASFSISGATLVAEFDGDFETKSNYSVLIRSTDNLGLFIEKEFTISVNNLAEAPSDIILSGSTIEENSSIGTFVGDLSSIDEDLLDSHNYSLVIGTGSDDNDLFSITGTGLYVNGNIDFETKSTLSILVRSTDLGGAYLEKQFNITVTNANDTPTDITLTGSTVDENTSTGTLVGDLSSVDEDVGDSFLFTLVAGTGSDDNALFTLSGAEVYTQFSPNYELKSAYSIRVQTADNLGATFEKAITISINDINEIPTDITLDTNSIDENLPIGTIVGDLTTTDEDVGDTYTYSLVSGTGSDDNAIFSISGATIVADFSADYETKNSYTILVQTTDAGGLTLEKQFTITINDINLAPSNLTLSGNTVDENLVSPVVIGELTGTDDGENNGTLTYSISCVTGGVDDAIFALSGTTLSINVTSDYETKSSYDVCVRVSDGILNLDQNFTISVNDINETPTDIGLTLTSINENLSVGTLVGTLSTTDEDLGDTHTYSLVSGTGSDDNLSFSISGSLLYAEFSADYEIKNSYSILVQSTDLGGLIIEKQFTISINDINAAPTDLTLSGSTINENSFVGTFIGTLIGTDDGENNGILTYSFTCGTPGIDDTSFTLSGSNLLSNAVFNFETKNTYDICVSVSDGNLSLDRNFTITVNDVNETPTDLILSSTSIDENLSIGTIVGNLSTTDEDTGDTHTYSLVAGTGSDDNANFSISGATLIAEFSADYETKNTYTILLQTTDAGGLVRIEQFTITINDINLAPTDLTMSGSTILENSFIGTVVGSLIGTDDNEDNGILTYTLTCATGGVDDIKFSIVGDELRTATQINFESGSTLNICVKVSDGLLSFDKNFVIDVINVNESPYSFILTQNTFNENVGTGFIVGNLSSLDEDFGDNHTYSFGTGPGSTHNSSFTLSGSEVIANFNPNYELNNLYEVKFKVTDSGGISTDLQSIISVNDVNEDPTDITLTGSSIDENIGTGSLVGLFSTEDEDIGDSHTYTFVGGIGSDDNTSFTIIGNALIADFVGDFETKNTYNIRIRSTDNGGLFTEKQFTITINDIDETGVLVTLSGSTLNENTSTGTLVGILNTTSSNTGATSFTYTLVTGTGSDDNSNFSISGAILVAEFIADYETKNNYSILVRSTDNLGNHTDKQFIINVLNQNEVPLDISLSSNTIDENIMGIYTIGNFSTIDTDNSDSHTYNLVGGVGSNDNADFAIVGNTLVGAFVPDYETKNTYYIRVRSTDAGGLMIEEQFTILINDLGENPTDITFSGSLSLDENMSTGTTLGDFSTTGTNSGVTYTYTLTGGVMDNDSFTISGTTLTANFSADYETKNIYNIQLRSTDSLGYFIEENFTITINNVNETPTDISLSANTLLENLSIGTTIGNLSTTDIDFGDTFTYSLVAGTGSDDNSSFSISGSTLIAEFSADYETKNTYNILVQSTDLGGLTTEKQFTISVTNENTAPSSLTLSGSTIDENLPIGTFIGELIGTDDGEDNGVLNYSLTCGTPGVDDTLFTLSGSSLFSNAVFNYETKNSYNICVKVTDGTLDLDQNFTITINDLVENPTDITFSGSLSIIEGTFTGYTMGDFDSVGVNTGVTYTYSFVTGTGSDDNLSFTLSGSTLSTNFNADYEIKNIYTIRIRTEDNLGASFEKQFTITIINQNNPPTDITLSGSTINENLPIGTLIGTLIGTDDGEDNGVLTFGLNCSTGGTDDASFNISGINLLSNAIYDFETKSTYNICIRVSDGTFTFDKNFVISINDVSETTSDIIFSGSLAFAENTVSGYILGDFDTTSTSIGLTYTYSLVAGTGSDDNTSFTLSGSTLITNFVPDYETKNTYTIRVSSTDSLSGTIEKQFSITINDVNEIPTDIALNNSSINENLGVGTIVGQLSSIDVDAGSTYTYALVSGTGSDNNALFSISGNNLIANFSADYETKNTYTIRVRSTDNGLLFTEKIFIISINDVSEGGGSSGGGSSGGGGGMLPALQKDTCPSGDYSPSYYDKTCGTKPTSTGSTSNGTTKSSTSTGSISSVTGSLDLATIEKLLDKSFKAIILVSSDGQKLTLQKTITGKYVLKNQDGKYINKVFGSMLQAKLYVSNLGDNERETMPELDNPLITIDLGFTPIIYKNSKGERFIVQKTTDGRYVLYTENGMKLNGYFTKLWHIIVYLKYN